LGDARERILHGIREHVTNLSEKIIPTDYFTPHDHTHCLAVQRIVQTLIAECRVKLTKLEEFLLMVSVWTHDIGMLDAVATPQLGEGYAIMAKRDTHDEISASYINTNEQFLCIFTDTGLSEGLTRSYLRTVSIVNRYHRRKTRVRDCPEHRHVEDEPVRGRLLACLLRLGDTLHVDSTRYEAKLYNMLQIGAFDRSARLHWLKSHMVSDVYLDSETQRIIVTIDLPATEKESNKGDTWDENVKKLKAIIRDDIYEDVQETRPTILAECKRFFADVIVNECYCYGFTDDMRAEILGILNDLAILSSPNTSKVIDKSVESILALSAKPFLTFERFANDVNVLVDQLRKVHGERPCDVALGKIIKTLSGIHDSFPTNGKQVTKGQIKKYTDALAQYAKTMTEQRERARAAIYEQADRVLKDKKNLFLFGYSEIVLGLLGAVTETGPKSDMNVFVFECSGKGQFSVQNDMEYNDGLHYALAVAKQGYKRVTLMPDTSFASLLNVPKTDAATNGLLLIGANSIEESSDDRPACSHSSGHLMMAIVAKAFGVPVITAADGIKRGEIDWEGLRCNRRGTAWLSGDRDLLAWIKREGIACWNYRADKIDAKWYDELITA